MIELKTDSNIVCEDIATVLADDLPWGNLRGKTVVVTGAGGMLPAYVVESLLSLGNVKVIALVRNVEKTRVRFSRYASRRDFVVRQYDFSSPVAFGENVNIIVHAASLPRPDTQHPVDVIRPNMIGTYYLLEAGRSCECFEQFIYFSSGAVYGENGVSGSVTEEMGSAIVPTDVRNCYSIAKISGEALCAAFCRQYNIPCKMLRYAHTFGPGMDLNNDVRAFAEFMRNVLLHQDIKLHTGGEQKRSYCYISDATVAFFRVLFLGASGTSYNISNADQTYSIREFAQCVLDVSKERVKVVVDAGARAAGYAPMRQPVLFSSARLHALGWIARTPLSVGIQRTLSAYAVR